MIPSLHRTITFWTHEQLDPPLTETSIDPNNCCKRPTFTLKMYHLFRYIITLKFHSGSTALKLYIMMHFLLVVYKLCYLKSNFILELKNFDSLISQAVCIFIYLFIYRLLPIKTEDFTLILIL